jgi:predicted protein tyrosine phosphatase
MALATRVVAEAQARRDSRRSPETGEMAGLVTRGSTVTCTAVAAVAVGTCRPKAREAQAAVVLRRLSPVLPVLRIAAVAAEVAETTGRLPLQEQAVPAS